MEEKVTGYPSVDKPWLKYYTAEMAQMPAPSSTIYEYLWENNKAHLKEAAIEYLGTVLPFGELFKKIDECAKALNALDVRPGDIVTVALPCVPEALYLVYALIRYVKSMTYIRTLLKQNTTQCATTLNI